MMSPVPPPLGGTGTSGKETLKEQLKARFVAKGRSVGSNEIEASADALLSFVKLLMEADRKNGFKVLKSCSDDIPAATANSLITE